MMDASDLISLDYLSEQIRLHGEPRGYGGRGRKWADTVEGLARQFNARSILDYGCGQGSLGLELRRRGWLVAEYDPAIIGKADLPSPADLVVCTDVLEHVEPDRIWQVVQHVSSMTIAQAFVVISLVPTAKTLTDGRQAHILLRSVEWWRTMLRAHGFVIVEELPIKPEKQWVAVLEKGSR